MVRKIQLCATIICLCFLFCSKCFALSIDDVIKNNPQFDSATIGISVKDSTGKVLYQKNQNKLLHPASTLKIITSSAAYDYLGESYEFKTILYKNGKNVYLKIGADPLFTYNDISNLISQYKTKNSGAIKNLIIDEKIVDDIPFGIGWQWDDNTNVHFPQMSPYIINNNLFPVKVHLNSDNDIKIEYANEYKEKVINNLKYGEKENVDVQRNIFNNNSFIVLSGTISKSEIINIPAKNPKALFMNVLIYSFLNNQIPITQNFKYDKIPLFSSKEAIVSHSINEVLKSINSNSNNLAAEILIKHAGGVKNETAGTTLNGLEVVKEYYKNKGLNYDSIQIVDASGASMNDYVTADFMTSALNIISKSNNFENIKKSMTDYNYGTYKGRNFELNGKLKVKTGTNANTSGVVGYLTTKSGKNIIIAILIDNLPKKVDSKKFEDEIIKAIYTCFAQN